MTPGSPTTPTVSFTRMDQGTAADYAILAALESEELAAYPDRVLGWLRDMDTHTGYQISRLDHSLQAATRAERAGEDADLVLGALLHDVGDILAPANHSQVAAAMLRPYVSDRVWWIVHHHGLFQMAHYAVTTGADPTGHERYRDHRWYEDGLRFSGEYDQVSFDPTYPTLPLSHFEPLVRAMLAAPRAAMA